jgi:hypothetical protein
LALRRTIQNKDVRELQELAQAAASRGDGRSGRKSFSRGAWLERIDILSRWSGAGLAFIAGLSIFLAIRIGPAAPARAAVWSALVFGALWACRRLLRRYRSGAGLSSRPFRWRATYASALCVLGVAFASAPVLLAPAETPPAMALQVIALVMIGAFAAGIVHSAHVASAAAFAAPAIALSFIAALRAGEPAFFLLVASLGTLGLAAIFAISSLIASNARRRNPRTHFLRRDRAPSRRSGAGPSVQSAATQKAR